MAGSVNKTDPLVSAYKCGASIPQIASRYNLSRSTIRNHLKRVGVLRSRVEAVRLAGKQGRLGSGLRGKKRTFTKKHREAISAAKREWGNKNAAGVSTKPNGYVEHTRGAHKGRAVHVTTMEARLGRRLKADECVHHIDGDRANNNDNNLALLTRSGHTRLHRREQRLSKATTKDK